MGIAAIIPNWSKGWPHCNWLSWLADLAGELLDRPAAGRTPGGFPRSV